MKGCARETMEANHQRLLSLLVANYFNVVSYLLQCHSRRCELGTPCASWTAMFPGSSGARSCCWCSLGIGKARVKRSVMYMTWFCICECHNDITVLTKYYTYHTKAQYGVDMLDSNSIRVIKPERCTDSRTNWQGQSRITKRHRSFWNHSTHSTSEWTQIKITNSYQYILIQKMYIYTQNYTQIYLYFFFPEINLINIISKLRIAWEIHVCAVSVAKNPKKATFFWELSRRHVSFPRILILIMASHPSRRGSNFCRFLASDVEKITIFWESTLCEIIAFFRTRQSLCKTKFQKKLLFWGIFPDVFFIMFPFPGYVFTLWFLGGPRRPVGKKWHFFGRRKIDVFSRETIRCFLAPALSLRRWISYLSANRLEPRISRDQHIQTCQFKTT